MGSKTNKWLPNSASPRQRKLCERSHIDVSVCECMRTLRDHFSRFMKRPGAGQWIKIHFARRRWWMASSPSEERVAPLPSAPFNHPSLTLLRGFQYTTGRYKIANETGKLSLEDYICIHSIACLLQLLSVFLLKSSYKVVICLI